MDTAVFSVAKLRLADVEKEVRAQGIAARAELESGNGGETSVGRFVAVYRQRTENNASLSIGTKLRREIAVKALLKTWPDLADRDVYLLICKATCLFISKSSACSQTSTVALVVSGVGASGV